MIQVQFSISMFGRLISEKKQTTTTITTLKTVNKFSTVVNRTAFVVKHFVFNAFKWTHKACSQCCEDLPSKMPFVWQAKCRTIDNLPAVKENADKWKNKRKTQHCTWVNKSSYYLTSCSCRHRYLYHKHYNHIWTERGKKAAWKKPKHTFLLFLIKQQSDFNYMHFNSQSELVCKM